MNQLRLLLLTAMAVFLVLGLLNQRENENFTSDLLFTLAFFAYIWHVLRRNRGAAPPTQQPPRATTPETPMERGPSSPPATSPAPPTQSAPPRQPAASKPYPPANPQPAPAPQPMAGEPARILFSTKPTRPSGRIILHKPPWAIVDQGKPVGQFRHVPIPAWIRTPDNRFADYSGIALTPPPEGCVCLEIPDQAELILPPGLIYAIRA
ncbi:MAG: hypothetical protein HQL97_15545 [Magnetococcales bacterium]|nr:hypothetical protein [Magnetococcales bacterium]